MPSCGSVMNAAAISTPSSTLWKLSPARIMLRRRRVARLVARRMHFARVVVAMAPEHELLEHEERQDAEQQREADAVRCRRRRSGLERVRQQAEERGARAARRWRSSRGAAAPRRARVVAEGEEERGGKRAQRSRSGAVKTMIRPRVLTGSSRSGPQIEVSLAWRVKRATPAWPCGPVTPSRRYEKKRSASSWVHQPPPCTSRTPPRSSARRASP